MNYKTIKNDGIFEEEIKKSRFICQLKRVDTEEEGRQFITQIKKEHYKATHSCSAMIIGEHAEIKRSSDDGEPSGTAGVPMLTVLEKQGLTNVVAVVTRYFGGTLLGTGGLVSAYSDAVREGLKECKMACCRYGVLLQIVTDYSGGGKVRYLLEQSGYREIDMDYSEQVSFRIMLPVEDYAKIEAEIIEITNGKATIQILEKKYYIEKESL